MPAQPVLFTLHRGGASIPAVAIGTKMGHVFVLDRRDGKPLFPVEERPVPPSDVPGEKASPTQPFPPPAFRLVPESLSANDAFGVTDSAAAACRRRIASLRYQGVFTPPSQQGTIIWPGNIGGVNWSGVSIDERRGLLIAPTNRLAMVVRLFPRDSLHAIASARPDAEYGRQTGTPYAMSREDLRICTPPPWGALTAIDLNAGRVKWQVPLGTLPPLEQIPASRPVGLVQPRRRVAHVEWPRVHRRHVRPALARVRRREREGAVERAASRRGERAADDVRRKRAPVCRDRRGRARSAAHDVGRLRARVHSSGQGRASAGHDRGNARRQLGGRGAHRRRSFRHGRHASQRRNQAIGYAEHRLASTRRSRDGDPQRTRAFDIAFPIVYPPKNNCTATIAFDVELWNAGTLLEGGGTIDGPCAEHGHQDVAFVFRRRR